MVDLNTFKQIALAFEHAVEQPHFEKPSYRIHQRIFATLDEKNYRATLKLSEVDQSVFCSIDPSIIYPVKGTWGKQGWTIIELNKIPKSLLTDAISAAYKTTSTKK